MNFKARRPAAAVPAAANSGVTLLTDAGGQDVSVPTPVSESEWRGCGEGECANPSTANWAVAAVRGVTSVADLWEVNK